MTLTVDLSPFVYIWLSLATVLFVVGTIKAVRNIWRG